MTTNGKTSILAGAMKFGPLGADPSDESAWTDIGHLAEGGLSFDSSMTAEEPYDVSKMADTVREITAQFEISKVSADAAALAFGGIPVIESPHVPASIGALIMGASIGFQIVAPRAEFRPFTDLEREGEWAKRTVRHGLTDVLAWLGEDVGPEPDDAYTDPGLYKVNLLGAIRGGIL